MPQFLRPSFLLLLLLFFAALTLTPTQAANHITAPRAWKALRSNKAFNAKVTERRLMDQIIRGLKSVLSRSSALLQREGGVLDAMKKRRGGAVARSAMFNRFFLAAVKDKLLPAGGDFNSLANPDHYTLFRYGRSV